MILLYHTFREKSSQNPMEKGEISVDMERQVVQYAVWKTAIKPYSPVFNAFHHCVIPLPRRWKQKAVPKQPAIPRKSTVSTTNAAQTIPVGSLTKVSVDKSQCGRKQMCAHLDLHKLYPPSPFHKSFCTGWNEQVRSQKAAFPSFSSRTTAPAKYHFPAARSS